MHPPNPTPRGTTPLSQPHHHPDGATKDRQACLHPAISTRGSRTLGDINHTKKPTTVSHKKLLRKEVIQPHLPVRLPCYDFVPIADPTFDSSF